MFCFPVFFLEFHQPVGCIKNSPGQNLWLNAACFATKVAKHSKSRWCRILGAICPTDWEGVGWDDPRSKKVRWLLWVTRLRKEFTRMFGEDSHVIWYAHHLSSSRVHNLSKNYYIYIHIIFYIYIFIYIDMLKHFVFCDAPILSPSTKLWILVRNIWRSFSARILQSGNPDKTDELIPKASCNSNTYSMLQATIVWHVLLISWSNHIYVYIIYISFFSLQSMSSFFWRRFSDRRCWGLSSVGGAGQIRPALVSRTQLFGWKTHSPDKSAKNGFVD